MFERLLAPLLETLRPHFGLSKTRLETLAVLLVGLANCRTVNLSHLASQFPGDAKHESNYRRLQRFFQFVHLDGDVAARLITQMLNLSRPRLLALDRTNWKLGSRDVNILVLAIVTRRFRVPLMWTLLDHAGNSATAQRIELMERYDAQLDQYGDILKAGVIDPTKVVRIALEYAASVAGLLVTTEAMVADKPAKPNRHGIPDMEGMEGMM